MTDLEGMPTRPEYKSSYRALVARSLVFCVMFCRSLFVLFLLAIVLSVIRFTASDYRFGIFKLFLLEIETLFKKKRLNVFYKDTKHNAFLLKSTGSAVIFVSLIIMICYGAVLYMYTKGEYCKSL